MALLIRTNKKIVCAAENKPQRGDIYVPDNLHRWLVEEKLLYSLDKGKTWNFIKGGG